MKRVRTVSDVAAWRLCVGCGACAYICPKKSVQLVDFVSEGIRPVLTESDCQDCHACIDVCPTVQTDFGLLKSRKDDDYICSEFDGGNVGNDWGRILEMWEGHAVDESIRFKGSSGGVLTALSAYCIEKLGMNGVLHIGQNPEDPLRNQTQFSQSREELLKATGSRYSPASVCDRLDWVEQAAAPCVVIGKPAEIAAVWNARRQRPSLDSNIGVTLSFFCAESPSTAGTAALLRKWGVSPEGLHELRYRGNGWPGHFAAVERGKLEPTVKLTYRESWSFLQAYRPWSVQLWPDGTGELADISCGDPWYEEPDGKNQGFSLVLVRTVRGRQIVRGAIEAGYVKLDPAEPWKLQRSQNNLLRKKGAVWGRLLVMRICGLPIPRFEGVSLFRCWLKLSMSEKLRSTIGTLRRIIGRGLYRRAKLNAALTQMVD